MNFTWFPIIAGCTLAALLLLVGHWFPWPRFLGRELHRLESYVYGTAVAMVGDLRQLKLALKRLRDDLERGTDG